ncbi:MAG: pyridoxal-phosphate dependent enzyme, partial [Anaerolineae bacterium]|nr:pyridoxal-phosphate dependent enzyme [Anaerolineae bacterium]
TPATARARIAAERARIIIHGQGFDEANERAKQVVAEVNGAYIHAFDDSAIWEGHASLVAEAVTQCPKPEAVVVAVGGGGLMSGLVLGMQRHGWADVPVISVETEGAASFAAALAAGRLETLPAITSIANTLGARRVTAKAVDLAQVHPIRSVIVSDRSAVKACLAFADDQRVIVEPACGAALSLLYGRADALADFNSVLMIVCGGAGVTMDQLRAWEAVA